MSDTKTKSAYEQLSNKQRLFVDQYIACGMNATKAARLAKYAHPNKQGPALIKTKKIKAAISERTAGAAMSADEVLLRLSRIARIDYADFITIHPAFEDSGEERVFLDLERAYKDGNLDLVKEYRREVSTVTGEDFERVTVTHKLKLHDAHSALKDLARHHGMFVDRLEVEDVTDPKETRQQVMDALNAIRAKVTRDASE